MIRPNKHSHPDQTVLAAATVVLRELRAKRTVGYDDLKSAIDSTLEGSDYLFIPAVSLLFLVGLTEYRASVDSFEYMGK